MKKYIRGIIGCVLAIATLAMASCGTVQEGDVSETTTSETTDAAVTTPQVEICTFEQVHFDGECHTVEHLEEYLADHLEELLVDMSVHGIAVDAYTEIRTAPIHIINLLTGSVGLQAHFLPVLERGELVNAVSVNLDDDVLTVSATMTWPWMAKVDSVLKENPQETYLLTNCLIEMGNYICLISSQNEIIYIVRPTNGGDLPFEDGVDYFGKLYDERLVVSYAKIYGDQASVGA